MSSMTPHTSCDDLQRFWMAVDASEGHAALLEAHLQETYFQQASTSLRQYIKWTGLEPQRLSSTYLAYAPYYQALREETENLIHLTNPDPFITTLQRHIPDTVSACVHFLLGDFTCAATVGRRTILLAAEFFPPTEVLDHAPEGISFFATDQLPIILAHELVHVQQIEAHDLDVKSLTLLELALLEGAAEYVGAFLSGGRSTPHAHTFGEVYGQEIWAAFEQETDTYDWQSWFYGAALRPGWPQDVGYFVGYELCRAYHKRHFKEPGVIKDIVFAFQSPERFYQKT